ncbi:BCCT family transporter [Ornithinimicrobium sp. Arc0846-15]|nr:BCCT family transporter [Ornithinimicrobium laminariae]
MPEDKPPVDSGAQGAADNPSAGIAAKAQRAGAKTAEVVREINYPHGVHPALVPGVSVEDQRIRYGTDKIVFGATAVSIVAFIAWGLLDTDGLTSASDTALSWVVTNIGWLFNIFAIIAVVFMMIVGFSRFGKIKLGLDNEGPEYSRASWLAMLFSAGMGIGLLFFGAYEPMTYFLAPPPGTVEPETIDAMHTALAQTTYHWGLNAWAMYALVGGAVAYGAYRRGRVPLMSSVLEPIFGQKHARGTLGRVVDIFAIVATLFGTAVSLGIGSLQIGRGLEIVGGFDPLGKSAIIAIIAVLTVCFIASAVSGVSRGIQWLSNTNMVLAFLLGAFIFIGGPTLFLLNFIPTSAIEYLRQLPTMMARSASMGEDAEAFVNAWTVFYWAWWISWTPFVGIFIAKISRGRTLREFVTVVLLVPTVVCLLAFSILGGTAMKFQLDGTADVGGAASPQDMLFQLLDALPASGLTSVVAMLMLAVFFITSADSGSLVMGMLSQRGKPEPDKGIVIFWGIMLSGIAIVMLLVGGNEALQGLQNLVIVSALPFSIVIFLMLAAFWKDLQTDPMIIRHSYGEHALDEAVQSGVAEHGDEFGINVGLAQEGHGAGRGFDSSDPAYTEWYQRFDEDGNEVEYDYATGQYIEASGEKVTEDDAEEREDARTVRAEGVQQEEYSNR